MKFACIYELYFLTGTAGHLRHVSCDLLHTSRSLLRFYKIKAKKKQTGLVEVHFTFSRGPRCLWTRLSKQRETEGRKREEEEEEGGKETDGGVEGGSETWKGGREGRQEVWIRREMWVKMHPCVKISEVQGQPLLHNSKHTGTRIQSIRAQTNPAPQKLSIT